MQTEIPPNQPVILRTLIRTRVEHVYLCCQSHSLFRRELIEVCDTDIWGYPMIQKLAYKPNFWMHFPWKKLQSHFKLVRRLTLPFYQAGVAQNKGKLPKYISRGKLIKHSFTEGWDMLVACAEQAQGWLGWFSRSSQHFLWTDCGKCIRSKINYKQVLAWVTWTGKTKQPFPLLRPHKIKTFPALWILFVEPSPLQSSFSLSTHCFSVKISSLVLLKKIVFKRSNDQFRAVPKYWNCQRWA